MFAPVIIIEPLRVVTSVVTVYTSFLTSQIEMTVPCARPRFAPVGISFLYKKWRTRRRRGPELAPYDTLVVYPHPTVWGIVRLPPCILCCRSVQLHLTSAARIFRQDMRSAICLERSRPGSATIRAVFSLVHLFVIITPSLAFSQANPFF